MTPTEDEPVFDDWEDVADDFSVLSFPDLEDVAKPDEVQAPSPAASLANDLATLSIGDESEVLNTESQEAESNIAEPQNPASTNIRELLERFPAQRSSADSNGDGEEQRVEDHVKVDPDFLKKVCSSLVNLINEIGPIIRPDGLRHADKNLEEASKVIFTACKHILKDLKDLGRMMATYGRYWDPNEPEIILPIDPALYEWFSHLKVDLLGVEALLLSRMGKCPTDLVTFTFKTELAGYGASLNEFRGQLTTFLPIMRSDYENFYAKKSSEEKSDEDSVHTATTTTPTARTETKGYHQSPQSSYQASEQTNFSGVLSCQFSDLAARVSNCAQALDEFAARQPRSVDSQFAQLNKFYRRLQMRLESMLKRDLDCGRRRGSTWDKVDRDLTPNKIRELIAQFDGIAQKFNAERNRARTVRLTVDPELQLDDMLEEDQQGPLQELAELQAALAGPFFRPEAT